MQEEEEEEEDEQERCSSTGEGSQQCSSSPWMEGCNVSDVSMADDGPQQHDSDIMVEEEESMEMDEPSNPAIPAPQPEKASSEGLETEAEEDHHSHTSEESTDQNLPHNLDLNKDELLGLLADISVPGGHSNDSVALVVSLGDDDL